MNYSGLRKGNISFNAVTMENANIEVSRVTAPLDPKVAWWIESFLLKVFEYGDYSFRSALLGEYSDTLDCTFFLAKYGGSLIGAAGCLCSGANSTVSIAGPVCVGEGYRTKGVGTKLVTSLINHLKSGGCKAIYLGVSAGNPAVDFYKKLGFTRYQGVVMRLVFGSPGSFEERYFDKYADLEVRKVVWGDYAAVMALAAYPCSMYTFDFGRNIFSSRYVEPSRFLSVFPEMMKVFAKNGGFANVLTVGKNGSIVGFAHLLRLPGKARNHIAELDFYIHDDFIDQGQGLVSRTIAESAHLSVAQVNCYCLACDLMKRSLLESVGAVQVALLPDNACVNNNLVDVLVYRV